MKRKLIVATVIIAFLAACSSSKPDSTQSSASSKSCNNLYYPVREGATWKYKSTGGPTGDHQFTDTIKSAQGDGFTLESKYEKLTRTQDWSCKSEGLAAQQLDDNAILALSSEDLNADFKTANVTGITYPKEIQVGKEWPQTLDFSADMTISNSPASAQGSANYNFKALGEESVTVPAGTFNAMKIQIDTNLTVTVTVQKILVPISYSGSYTYWFVKDVGWVKAEGIGNVAGKPFNETITLESYNIP